MLLAAAFVIIGLIAVVWLWRLNGVDIAATGIDPGGAVKTEETQALEIAIAVEPTGRLGDATLRFDGEDVTEDAERTDSGFLWRPPEEFLEEGDYRLDLSVPRTLFGSASWSLDFSVDDTAPVIDVEAPEPASLEEGITLRGTVDEEATVTAGDRTVEVDEEGRFELAFDRLPVGAVRLVATDLAGNEASVSQAVPIRYPEGGAAHVSAAVWEDAERRDAVLGLLDDGQRDAVVVDLKNECGIVTYASEVDLARQIGAVRERIDLPELIDEVTGRGGRVIGRIVTFRDPLLVRWAWANGNIGWVLQDTAGDPWPVFGGTDGCPEATNAPALSGGFANFNAPEVHDYNTALAVEAAELGVDEIVLVDARRPDGSLENMVLSAPLEPAEAIAQFVQGVRREVRAQDALVGVALHPLSVNDPTLFDQDPAELADAADYLAPLIFPEGYSSGFFNVVDPESQPGETVRGGLGAIDEQLDGHPVPRVVWIQDYSGAVTYGLPQVQAQVDAAAAAGVCAWVTDDPDGTYTPGLQPAC